MIDIVIGNKSGPKFKEMNKELRDLTFYKCSNDEKDKLERIHILLNEGVRNIIKQKIRDFKLDKLL